MVMGQYAVINGRHALKTVLKHYGVILVDYRLYQNKACYAPVICAFTHVILASDRMSASFHTLSTGVSSMLRFM